MVNFFKIVIVISLINALMTISYGNILELPFIFSDFPPKGDSSCLKSIEMCFIPDIYVYLDIIENNKLESIFEKFSNGLTAIHILLYSLIEADNVILSSIIINSLVLSIPFAILFGSVNNALKIYFLFIFYFIFYSFGPTKEILISSAIIIFINSEILIKNYYCKFLSILMIIISRPQFLPIFLFGKILHKNKFFLFILLFMLCSPFFEPLLPGDWISTGDAFYDLQSKASLSRDIDYYKFTTPVLSLLGWISSITKTILEPILLFIDYGLIKIQIYLLVSLTVYLSFIFSLYFYLKKHHLKIPIFIINFSMFFLVIVCTLPIIHHRYILPLMVGISINLFALYFNREPNKCIQ
jgi:hypothetical protein